MCQVETRIVTRAVRRNIERFPDDFMFQLTEEEWQILRSQYGTSSRWGGRRYPPNAFTEQGVAMLSGVLHSDEAVQVNIEIVRAFVRLRKLMATHRDLADKVIELEKKYDEQFRVVFEVIEQLLAPPNKITYKVTGVSAEDLIQEMRTSHNPRIAVTIDMIAAGTDMEPHIALLTQDNPDTR